MATSQEIAELRINIKEPNNVEPWTDEFLGDMIDAYGVDEASYRIWRSKATTVNSLVDISEGGSSRKMSQVYENYLKTADSFLPNTKTAKAVSTTREITR